MKTLIKTSLLATLMISCHLGAMQDTSLGMRTTTDWELIEAAKAGDTTQVENLLKQGADIETRDYDVDDDTEYTPLHHACDKGHKDVVECLLEHRAKVDALTSTKGRTPLHYACMAGNLEIVKLLIGKGADVKKTDNKGGTPLQYAVRAGRLRIVQYFHNKIFHNNIDVDMNPRDRDGLTLLHAAAASGNVELVRYLQEIYKGDISQEDNDNSTPLHYAAVMGYKDVVELFVGINKSIVDLKSKHGNTALHFAAANGREEVVKSLLAAGAGVTIKNNRGTTPLAIARRKGYTAIVVQLERAMPDQEVSRKHDSSSPIPPTQSLPKRSKREVEIH